MKTVFTDFSVSPSYSKGFVFSWEISGDFNDEGPWEFKVQEGESPTGPWTTISPVLTNSFSWHESTRKTINKANVLYFRVCLKTCDGSYSSPVIQPYGTLGRRDFLLAREIMRQSVLHSRGMAGVECRVYLLSTFGPKCTECLDPITGMVRNTHCDHCYGTGRDPAYHGPYDIWVDFSEDNQHQVMTDKTGTVEKKTFTVRAIGNPCLKHGDVIVVPSSDKRYIVDTAAMTSELRRIPIIQTLVVEEAPQTDKVYDL